MTAHVDLDALVRLAEAATPGPWVAEYGAITAKSDSSKRVMSSPDLRHIAAASPDVVLALVERVRAAEAAVERWQEVANLAADSGQAMAKAVTDLADHWEQSRSPVHETPQELAQMLREAIGSNAPESHGNGPRSDAGADQALPPLPVDTETFSERSIRAMQEKDARRCTCLIVVQVGPKWQHTCHCGEPVTYGYDGDPFHHRGMCAHCDPVRCDAYPGECGR